MPITAHFGEVFFGGGLTL